MRTGNPRTVRLWTPAEFARITDAAATMRGYGDNFIQRRLFATALVSVIHETGLSRFWLWKIGRSNLRADGRLVARNQFNFQLSPDCLAAIDATFPPERELLLPWHGGRRGFYNLLERIFDRAEILPERRFAWFERRRLLCVGN